MAIVKGHIRHTRRGATAVRAHIRKEGRLSEEELLRGMQEDTFEEGRRAYLLDVKYRGMAFGSRKEASKAAREAANIMYKRPYRAEIIRGYMYQFEKEK